MYGYLIAGIAVGIILLFMVNPILSDEVDRRYWSDWWKVLPTLFGLPILIASLVLFCGQCGKDIEASEKACTELSRFEKGDVVQVAGLEEKKFIVKTYGCYKQKVKYTLVAEGLPELEIEESKLK